MAYETFEDVTADFHGFIDQVTTPADSTPRWLSSPAQYQDRHAQQPVKNAA